MFKIFQTETSKSISRYQPQSPLLKRAPWKIRSLHLFIWEKYLKYFFSETVSNMGNGASSQRDRESLFSRPFLWEQSTSNCRFKVGDRNWTKRKSGIFWFGREVCPGMGIMSSAVLVFGLQPIIGGEALDRTTLHLAKIILFSISSGKVNSDQVRSG